MRHLTVCIDLDDVCWDLVTPWVLELNRLHHLTVDPYNLPDWELTKAFPTLTPNEVWEPLTHPELYSQLEPIEGAQEYTRQWMDKGMLVCLLTNTSPFYDTIYAKFQAFSKLFPHIPQSNVIIAARKWMINGDVLVDDSPANIEKWEHFGLLFDRPGNQNAVLNPANAERVMDWHELNKRVLYLNEALWG